MERQRTVQRCSEILNHLFICICVDIEPMAGYMVEEDFVTLLKEAAHFFGKQPERKFPHAITRCVLFKGTNKVYIIDDKTFGGSLYQQYLQAIAWLESKLQVAYKIEGTGPREEIWEIPLTVFKEAIINALSHRDYYEQGASIMIEMFDDRVEISNPGGLLPVDMLTDFRSI